MNSKKNAKIHNAGFSLVELIIVVSILAIAAVPLMKSMGMAARTNAKAQSIQNATSLAESVMEEMKSTPIEDLKTRYAGKYSMDPSGDVMTITMSDETATQGEKFDVTVTIDKSTYAAGDGDISTPVDNVIDANSLELPSIEAIDSDTQAVLTSVKELNKYDRAALSYFNERIADYPARSASIAKKTIEIIKSTDDELYYPNASVKAIVTYIDDSGNPYIRDLYNGTFVPQEREDGSYPPILNSNIYIFYKASAEPIGEEEKITIRDNSGGLLTHKVYFVKQDSSSGPILDIDGTSFDISNGDIPDGDVGGMEVISNLSGHIYKEEARTRVYDINVVLKKDGDDITKYAELNSTVTANDKIITSP